MVRARVMVSVIFGVTVAYPAERNVIFHSTGGAIIKYVANSVNSFLNIIKYSISFTTEVASPGE